MICKHEQRRTNAATGERATLVDNLLRLMHKAVMPTGYGTHRRSGLVNRIPESSIKFIKGLIIGEYAMLLPVGQCTYHSRPSCPGHTAPFPYPCQAAAAVAASSQERINQWMGCLQGGEIHELSSDA